MITTVKSSKTRSCNGCNGKDDVYEIIVSVMSHGTSVALCKHCRNWMITDLKAITPENKKDETEGE